MPTLGAASTADRAGGQKRLGPVARGGSVALVDVTRRFAGAGGVSDLSLAADGEFLTLIGPSGSGKSTTLRLIGGFLQPQSGRVLLGGIDVTATPAYRRPVHTVFQDYALFPHLTVGENIAYPLEMAGVAARERRRRVGEALELVRLPGIAARRPAQLSGGQQQRVALARALVNRPPILLLDEPLGALDVQLRQEMQGELKRIREEVGATFVAVTHDQAEALATADRIAVLRAGRLVEIGTPQQLYTRPRTQFVAEFVGQHTVLPATVRGHDPAGTTVSLVDGTLLRAASDGLAPPVGAPVVVAFRPDRVRLAPAATDSDVSSAAVSAAVGLAAMTGGAGAGPVNAILVTVADVSFAGATWQIETRLRTGARLNARLPAGWEDSAAWRRGAAAQALVAPADTLLLADEGGTDAESADH